MRSSQKHACACVCARMRRVCQHVYVRACVCGMCARVHTQDDEHEHLSSASLRSSLLSSGPVPSCCARAAATASAGAADVDSAVLLLVGLPRPPVAIKLRTGWCALADTDVDTDADAAGLPVATAALEVRRLRPSHLELRP